MSQPLLLPAPDTMRDEALPTLVYSPHPLLAAAGRRLEYAYFLPGESIAEYLDRIGIWIPPHQPVALAVNGARVPREMWARCRPKPGMLITLRAVVQGGGGGGGKSPVKTILSIALMVAAPALGAALGQAIGLTGTAFSVFGQAISWSTILGGVISIGGSLLLNALMPAPRPQLSEASGRFSSESVSPTYALSGGSNRARPFEPMPLLLGRHRIFPDYGAKFYTEFLGEDQYLYQVFHFGLSDLALSDFRIGNTPDSNFTDVDIEVAGADGKLTLFPANVDTTQGGSLTAAAGWVQRTSSIDATALGVDIAGSLYYAGDTGIAALSVTLEMEYRAVGSGTWLPLVGTASAVTLTSSSRKPLRMSYRKDVAQGQYEVRVRRTTADETDARAVSDIAWSQLRTYQPDLADYTGQKRVAVRMKASGQLNGQIEQFSAIGEATIPVWNGSAWVDQVSSNPAWLFLWFARGKKIGNRRIYGACLPDARIDIEALKDWGIWCDAKQLTFNGVIDANMSCAELLDRIATCGRGSKTWATGKLGVIWDAAGQPVVAVFGMANIKRRSFQVEWTTENLADEVVTRFVNPSKDWQQDEVRAKVPGVTDPTRPAIVELFGCTDAVMAGRDATLRAANHAYRLRRVAFETDWEGMVANRGDVIAVSHDLTQWGYSGRIVAGDGATLTLDRAVAFTPGELHYVRVVFPNGWFDVFAVNYSAGESDTLSLAEPWPTQDGEMNTLYTPNADPTHPPWDYQWQFEPLATPGRKLKIVGMDAPDTRSVRIIAMDEPDDYYLQENNAYTYVDPGAGAAEVPTLTNLEISETLVRVGTGYAVLLSLTWDASGPYEQAVIRAGLDGAPLAEAGRSFGRRHEWQVPDAGTISIEITGFSPRGLWGAASRIAATYPIAGKAALPSNVPWFVISAEVLTWGAVADVDLAGYRIRWQPGSSLSWGSANPLHDGLVVSSPYTMIDRPSGAVTLLIKAVDTSGNESETAAAIATNLGDALLDNVILTHDFHVAGFPGTKTACTVEAGTGDLIANIDSDPLMWSSDADSMWTGDNDPMWDSATYAAMSYVDQYTFTSTEAGGTLTLARAITGASYEISYRRVTTPAEAWRAWPGSLVVEAAVYDFRCSVAPGGVQGRISQLVAHVDVPDVTETLGDVTIASGGTRLSPTKSYRAITAVNLTLQADGGSARTARVEDKSVSLGPLVKCLDSSGAGTSGKVDAIIQGY